MKKKYVSIIAVVVGFSAIIANAQLPYTDGLDVWLDASDIDGSGNSSLTDGDAMTTWFNKGTTGVADATPNPVRGVSTYAAAAGGVNQAAVTLSNSLYLLEEFSDSTSRTMYFVVNRAASSGAEGTLFNDYGETGAQLLILRTGSTSGQRDASLDATWLTSPVDVDSQWMTVFYSFNGTNGNVSFGEVGGTIVTGTSPGGYDLTTTFEGGADPVLFGFSPGVDSHAFDGLVSEVLIYDHLLDAAQQATVETYLDAKAVPEPATLGLVALFGGGLLFIRRKLAL